MVSVNRVSFMADEQTVKPNQTQINNIFSRPGLHTVPVSSIPQIAVQQQPQFDTYLPQQESPVAKSLNGLQKYSGPIALAVSVAALPITYAFGRKSNQKMVNQLKTELSESIANKIQSLNIEAKVEQAIGEVIKKKPTAGIKTKEALTAFLIGGGSAAGITELLKQNKDKLVENGLTGKEIEAAEKDAERIVNSSYVAFENRDKLGEVSSQVKSLNMQSPDPFVARVVTINGKDLKLASVMHGYGKTEPKMTETLQTESAKRIFGVVDRTKKTAPDSVTIRVPTSEYRGFTSTGGMSIVPKEIISNLAGIINTKQNARLIADTPLYLGEASENNFYVLKKLQGNQYEYVNSTSSGDSVMAKLEKIGEMNIPIYTDKAVNDEKVELFKATDLKAPIDYNLLKEHLDENTLIEIKSEVEKSGSYSNGLIKIESPVYGQFKAYALYDAVFYKNDKFDMSGPSCDKKNIYNDKTHNAGETERFTYFSKFFFEHLWKSQTYKEDSLGADLIIGNDWQTGPISAMMRQLTTARKNFGADPKFADKLHDTPIVTVMHNAGLSGAIWHSQSKLLNIMFGEHAAKIVENSWMPSGCSLSKEALNGMFNDDGINPQTMASAYSDYIVPVSSGYADEIANTSIFGKANHDIFKIRARKYEFSDENKLKEIAKANSLDENAISLEPTCFGITNGCDRVNNTLTTEAARKLETILGLKESSIQVASDFENTVQWHNHNKEVYLNKMIEDLNTAKTTDKNPMKIFMPELTDLSGVTVNTPVFATAGRIVDQKGLDIYAEAVEEFLDNYKGEEYPVFYAQGTVNPGDEKFAEAFTNVKKRIAEKNPEAANRMVFASLFSEPGRYDGCKLMSDFTIMSSWFEPCGLVHKEIAAYSGAVPVVNKVGGLTDGLTDNVNAIFAEFSPKPYDGKEGDKEALAKNRKNFANALSRAVELYNDKERFANVMDSSFKTNHDWMKQGGPIEKYAKLFVDLKVLKPTIIGLPEEKPVEVA